MVTRPGRAPAGRRRAHLSASGSSPAARRWSCAERRFSSWLRRTPGAGSATASGGSCGRGRAPSSATGAACEILARDAAPRGAARRAGAGRASARPTGPSRPARQPQAHLRPVRHRRLQPPRPRRRAHGRRDARPGLQPALPLRTAGRRQDPPPELDREPRRHPQPGPARSASPPARPSPTHSSPPSPAGAPTPSRHASATSTCCCSTTSSSSSARPAPRRSSSTPSTRSTTAGARSCSPPTARRATSRRLEDRLRERFQSGLVADIAPPDLATRMAILRKRAQHDARRRRRRRAPCELIAAAQSTSNVRALEGALIRVVAFSSLTGRPLTAELAHEVLDGLYPAPSPPGPPHDRRDPGRRLRALRHHPRGAPLPHPQPSRRLAPPARHVPRPRAHRRVAARHRTRSSADATTPRCSTPAGAPSERIATDARRRPGCGEAVRTLGVTQLRDHLAAPDRPA